MKNVILISALVLAGCSTTVPVVVKFPEAPESLMQQCPPLKTIEGDNISIVDITKTTTLNYTAYYECAVKLENWIEWHKTQKQIFEKIK